MNANGHADVGVRSATLALTALATASAELAVAEPGESALVSLTRATLWFLTTQAVSWVIWHRVGPRGRTARGRASAQRDRAEIPSWITLAIVLFFSAPFAAEGFRLVLFERSAPLEIVLIRALRNLGLGLAVPSGRTSFTRMAALVSLFLVLIGTSIADGPVVFAVIGASALAGSVWLALAYWQALGLPKAPGERGQFPVGALVSALLVVALVGGVVALGPLRAATSLASLLPSSGGTDWDNPEARGGVGDGEHEVKGSEKPQSIGFTDTDVYLDSDRPSLYDAFNETYGEPSKPKKLDRMIALGNQNVVEQREHPAENLQAGREFSAVRRPSERGNRRPSDREAKALLYVKGRTPLHLGLAAYGHFDGRVWHEEPETAHDCTLTREPGHDPWFRLANPRFDHFAELAAHSIKIGTLDSSPLPTPSHVHRFRIGQVDRADFFGWSHEGILRMVGRTVPTGTVIQTECRIPDPDRVGALVFPDAFYAAPRLLKMADDRPIAARIQSLARTWAADLPRGWGQVEAIVAKVREHGAIDRAAAAPPDCEDVACHFLFESRRGPDYLFATSAALLLRSLGYPTRLVSGLYAAPDRYDPRTRHTPVTREDVHVWAEVRLPSGAWVAIEPTPGYELLAPSPSWGTLAMRALASVRDWAVAHATQIGLALVASLCLYRFRRELANSSATLAWRLCPPADARHCVVAAVLLLDRRSRWAGMPRPPSRTPARWYGDLAAGDPEGVGRLLRLAEWGLYAPAHVGPPLGTGDPDPRELCRRALAAWPLSRFRSLSDSRRQLEGRE